MARRSKNNSSVMWFITGMLVVILIIGLYYLQQHSNTPSKSIKADKQSATTPTTNKPKFDFYSVLPQQQNNNNNAKPTTLPAPNKKITPPKNLTGIPTPTTATSHAKSPQTLPAPKKVVATRYYLQIAAVKNYADADKLKAELILEGYNANIEKININHVNYNRVNLGPYTSLDKAKKDQAKLIKNNIKSILFGEKIKPN